MNKYNKLHDMIVDDDNVLDIMEIELDITDEGSVVLNYFVKFETDGVEAAIDGLAKKVKGLGGIVPSLVEGQLEDAIAENEDTVEIDLNFTLEDEADGICL